MSKTKFIVSTDSCVDHFKSYLDLRGVYCIILKRITNGVASEELYDSYAEYEKFYSDLQGGALPTTSQLNPFELEEHFRHILAAEPEGDIIHLPLSSGLSSTCDNAKAAAASVNQWLVGRKVYVVDSLSATLGMGMLVDRLVELRDAGISAEDAVKQIEHVRDHQQVWAIVQNLFHLVRGGRISGLSAAIGTVFKVRPILIINRHGKLTVESKVPGTKRAIEYVIDKMEELGVKAGTDFTKSAIYLAHSAVPEFLEQVEAAIIKRFGDVRIKKGLIGPIIGTHVGNGAVGILFEGTERLDI